MAYVSVTVTLTAADTNYNLLSLVRAARPNASALSRELTLQADSANTAPVLVGDSNLSAMDIGFSIAAGQYVQHRSSFPSVPLGGVWVRSSAAGQRLRVTSLEA